MLYFGIHTNVIEVFQDITGAQTFRRKEFNKRIELQFT